MMNLSELGLQQEREIRCIVTQDLRKRIKVYYNDFENVKKQIGQKMVTVFEANEEDRKMIIELVEEGIKEELASGKDVEKSNLSISGVDFVILLLQKLTDINLDIDIEDTSTITKILDRPTNLLLAVHKEITIMCNNIIDELYENMLMFSERPDGVRQVLLNQYNADVKNQEKTNEEIVDEVEQQ